jgi:hypothetical protein
MVTTPRRLRIPALRSLTLLTYAMVVPGLIAFQAFAQKAPLPERKQENYALIFGTVWGPDDHPLYGVKVRIRRGDQKKPHWELYSDHNGEFAQRVPVGPNDYYVWADLKGYKSLTGKELHQNSEVKMHIDKDERQDIGLHLR